MFRVYKKFSHAQFAFLSGVAICCLTISLVWVEKKNSFHALSAVSRNVAEITADRIQATLNRIDTRLKILASRYEDLPNLSLERLAQLETQLRHEASFYELPLRFLVISRDGQEVLNTGNNREANNAPTKLAHQGFFQEFEAGNHSLVYQGPVQSDQAGAWSILMARPILNSDKQFQGAVVAKIPAERIAKKIQGAELGLNGSVSLYNANFELILSNNGIESGSKGQPPGQEVVPKAFLETTQSHPGQLQHLIQTRSELDGIERLYILQKLGSAPFYLSVGRTTESYKAAWQSTAVIAGGICAFILFILVFGSRKLDRQRATLEQKVIEKTKSFYVAKERAEKSEARLINAAKSASIGLWVQDIKTGAFVWDERMFAMYGLEDLDTNEMVSFKTWKRRIHPDDLHATLKSIEELQEKGEGKCDLSFRIVRPNGHLRHLQGSAFVEKNELEQATHLVGVNFDVTDLKQSQEDFKEAQRIARVGSWHYRMDTKEVVWSEELYRIFGLDPNQPAPHYLTHDRYYTPESWRTVSEAVAQIEKDGTPYEIELEIVRPDGEHVWVTSRGERLTDSFGTPISLWGTATDITEFKKQREQLQLARQEAEAANEAKSKFLSVISHEIRTPLNAIIGTSYLMSQGKLTDTQAQDLRTINVSGKSLLALINDVLDFSKIEAGEMEIDHHLFSLEEVLGDLRVMFAQLAADKKIDLIIHSAPSGVPVMLGGDSNRLKQILINLLSNAIKFSS
ncbi:MAG: PAS domain-containing protein, partial [Limnobacter sp.]|nr:PAS domain-containing protein [Limnobacter sp.]